MNHKNNYIYLLVGLLLMLVLTPLSLELQPDSSLPIVRLIFCGMLVFAVMSIQWLKTWKFVGVGLVLAAIMATVFGALFHLDLSVILGFIFFSFCLLTIVIVLADVLRAGAITLNRLVGSLCVYLLLGVTWGQVYVLVEVVFPGSFGELSFADSGDLQFELIYYSFSTLTTLGYGDISPVRPLAKGFAVMEACCGVLYVSILIGRLLGEHLSARANAE